MAEGTATWEGGAIPLYGESEIQQQGTSDILTLTSASGNTADFLVAQDSSGTEVWRLEDDGRVWQSRTFGGAGGDNYACYATATANRSAGGQAYAATFLLDEATYNVGGGRNATLYLRYDADASGGSAAARSWINYDDHGTDCPTFFVMPNTTTADTVFQTNTQGAATHGLRVYIGGTLYFLMLTDTA